MRGEFWIIDGYAVDASDNGDYSHEGYAAEAIQNMVAEKMGAYNSVDRPWEDTLNEIANLLADPENPHHVAALEDEDYETIVQDKWGDYGVSEEERLICYGGGNASLYAAKHLGWHRLVDNFVETWVFNPGVANEILDGLYDAYPNIEEEDDDLGIEIYVSTPPRSLFFTLKELHEYSKSPTPPLPPLLDTDLANLAATQYTKEQNLSLLHPFYKRYGD